MANALYDTYKECLLDPGSGANGDVPDLNTDNIDVSLHSSTYSFSAAHAAFSELSGQIDSQREVVPATISVTNGTYDGGDVVFTAVASGSTIDSYIFAEDTGVAANDQLIVYFDTDTGGAISVATNDGDITVAHNASGIFAL